MVSEYAHFILNLLLVLGLMIGLIFLVKKFKLNRKMGNKHINILNVVSIGAKERLILVEVNNAYLLVGATPTHIETLHVFSELEKKEAVDDVCKPSITFKEQMKELQKTT